MVIFCLLQKLLTNYVGILPRQGSRTICHLSYFRFGSIWMLLSSYLLPYLCMHIDVVLRANQRLYIQMMCAAIPMVSVATQVSVYDLGAGLQAWAYEALWGYVGHSNLIPARLPTPASKTHTHTRLNTCTHINTHSLTRKDSHTEHTLSTQAWMHIFTWNVLMSSSTHIYNPQPFWVLCCRLNIHSSINQKYPLRASATEATYSYSCVFVWVWQTWQSL